VSGLKNPESIATLYLSMWRRGATPNAAAAIAEHPALAMDRDASIGLAFDEYCLRVEAGEVVNRRSFANRFDFADSLLRRLEVQSLFNKNPGLIPAAVPSIRYQPGDHVDDYEFIRRLGQGGFADVYLVRDHAAGKRGAVLKWASSNAEEAQKLAPLEHPNLMRVLTAPRLRNQRALLMPYYGSTTVEWLIGQRQSKPTGLTTAALIQGIQDTVVPNDPETTPSPSLQLKPTDSYDVVVRRIATRLASVLAYLHGQRMAHRDIKPANILLGDTLHPYLLDFNLAGESAQQGPIVGTLPYLAPELLHLLTHTSKQETIAISWPTADIFSFGVVMYELLTGHHPYVNLREIPVVSGTLQKAKMIYDKQASFVASGTKAIGKPLGREWSWIERCLRLRPEERPSAAELEKQLNAFDRSTWLRRGAWVLGGVMAAGVVAGVTTARFYPTWFPSKHGFVQTLPHDAYERGFHFYNSGEWTLATESFLQAGKERNDGRAFTAAAYCLAQSGSCRDALYRLEQARQAGDNRVLVELISAYCYIHLDRADLAQQAVDRVLQQDANCEPARYSLQLLKYRHIRGGVAKVTRAQRDEFMTVLQNCPPTTGAYYVGAMLHLELEEPTPADLDEAVRLFREAVKLGYSPEHLRHSPEVVSRLGSHPEWNKLMDFLPEVNIPRWNPHLGELTE
jgi:eukaryotic-like serine/threonine-protein kinase